LQGFAYDRLTPGEIGIENLAQFSEFYSIKEIREPEAGYTELKIVP